MKQLFAALALTFCCLLAVPAHAARQASSTADETYDECMTQSDGITDSLVDKLWRQVDDYFHHGDYPRIIGLDRIITQADPNFVECYSTGGWLMDSLGRKSDAEAFYQEGCRNNPGSSPMYYSLGMFYYNSIHDYSAAVSVYQRDTQIMDSDINDWKMLAHSYERAKKIDKAVDTWKTIKTRWPDGPAVQANLNRILALQRRSG